MCSITLISVKCLSLSQVCHWSATNELKPLHRIVFILSLPMTVQLNSKVHRLELLSLYVLLGNPDGRALLNKINWHLEIERKVTGLVSSYLQAFSFIFL